jgi:SulP family sulfate permease
MEDGSGKGRWIADAIAGASVAFIAIPQGLAYAEIAGMPAYTGLYATAVPAVLAGFTSDSRYLQTGPVATTSLLTFGALASLGAAAKSEEYIALAAVLALLVGVVRLLLGFMKLGGIADLMSRPIILGFTSAAAILIAGSQSDKAFGVEGAPGGFLQKLLFVLAHPGDWNWAAIGLSVLTAALVVGGKRIHSAFPGVMLAVLVGIVIGRMDSYPASLVGTVPSGLPNFSFAFMWSAIPSLLIPAIVIAVVGFSEATAVARTFAIQDRERWSANKELISQGVANMASAVSGGFPIGASFSRSSLNQSAGARTRWAGFFTGITILAFLPFASVVSSLPNAVLGAVVIIAVVKLIRVDKLLGLFKIAKLQGTIGVATFIATIALAPRVDLAVLLAILVAIGVHLYREISRVNVEAEVDADTLVIYPAGVLFFASANRFHDTILTRVADHPGITTVVFDLSKLGRIDYSGTLTLQEIAESLAKADLLVEVRGVGAHSEKTFNRTGGLGF